MYSVNHFRTLEYDYKCRHIESAKRCVTKKYETNAYLYFLRALRSEP